MKEDLRQPSLLMYFSALARLLEKNEDNVTTYFLVYAVFNLINSLKLMKQVDNPGMMHVPLRGIETMTIGDMDYQALASVFVKSNLFQQVLLQPQKVDADEETIRVSTKLLATLVFKANS